MATPWVDDRLSEAQELLREGRFRSALDRLLPVLSVYPGQPEALSLAGTTLYLASSRKRAQESPEPLTLRYFNDPRLDRLFCECEARGCGVAWVSARVGLPGQERIHVSNPVGGRCERCGAYSCTRHFTRSVAPEGLVSVGCPACGGPIDSAPPPSGRQTRQTIRLNQPLIHVFVLREGPLPVGPDFLKTLFETLSPDVLEDSAQISAWPCPKWPDDPRDLALALVARNHPEYLGETCDVHPVDGRDREGTRWALVKVFARRARHVDPSV